MSAPASPVHGRAPAALSSCTASTGASEGTGSPVNGDSGRTECDADVDGEEEGVVIADADRTGAPLARTSTAPTTRLAATIVMATV